MDLSGQREQLCGWLRRCLIGGDGTPDRLSGIRPLDRYHSAILFPVVRGEYGLDHGAEPEDGGVDASDDDAVEFGPEQGSRQGAPAESPRKRRFVPPSSVGFSFFVAGDDIRLQLIAGAVRFVAEGEPDDKGLMRDALGRFLSDWRRERLGGDAEAQDIAAPSARRTTTWRAPALFTGGGGALAELLVLWRPLAEGWLVTASLSNTQTLEPSGRPQNEVHRDFRLEAQERNERALFEVELACVIDAGDVGPYPGVSYRNLTEEEQELELQYRTHRVYAVGHGAAADWQQARGDAGRVQVVRAEFLPRVEVPQVSADIGGPGQEALAIGWLADIESDVAERCDALARFVSGYRDWVQHSAAGLGRFDAHEGRAAQRILRRMDVALERMQVGIALLRRDPLATRAFGLANRAMERQMAQTDRAAGRAPGDYRWRPFQLAFLLLTLEPTIEQDSEYRDTLDLIWFPTGGGKTEAYLGLMAFLICWRRLRFDASGGGTAVLMRYTLRLLTKDQFRRGARLICALELLRRETAALGSEPITLGLWVGQASSPNTFSGARHALDQALQSGASPPSLLVLDACPWCGDRFSAAANYDAGPKHFLFRCTNPGCEFGREAPGALPCNVVDAALYETPPTLLLATIDKFARLAWEERAGAFFGVGGNRPPELIIQDELHLIAAALGSVAGLYEAGIETVLRRRGIRPKYVASTATIRMAGDQVRLLYGRDAAIFPPPGLDCDDSYFARTLPLAEQPGRLYLGYLAPARDRAHCLAPLAGALLAAPEVLFDGAGAERETLLDAWWTLLVYHGSLKGVGISRNALADIETFLGRCQAEVRERPAAGAAAETSDAAQASPHLGWTRLAQLAEGLTQLTSQMSVDDNAATFEQLRLPRGDPRALDLVLATNMISVGLDVARLALMIINGQPLTTAEYIQASSRVGRAGVPGLVVANYYRDQARSLSHYEVFRAYHESFYRWVEPTSVTPFTHQARLRALHAALVISVRHGEPRLADNKAAGRFDPHDPAIAAIIDELKRRCWEAALDPAHLAQAETAQLKAAIGDHVDELARQWAAEAERCAGRAETLVYNARDSDAKHQRLLYSHEARIKGLWATLNNMRNVENTSKVKIL